ncbi:hypothetical protein [Cutibacterium granulosum]|uniref:hypothetical protein n=1 Tax=Cutibacterium granulosum TaxID=33011 RepID=UPI002B23E185|nr:hypothetical protein [Cutibacterium granulosum]MEA5638445.1 hypothetical protein [Cutibacterium granulosum]
MDRSSTTAHRRGKWRFTNSRRVQRTRLAVTIVALIGSVLLLALGIAAWSLPETDDIHVSPGSTVHLHRSPPLSRGQAVFVDKSIEFGSSERESILSCTLTRSSTTERVVSPADPSIGERARENTALRPVLSLGTTKGNETLDCSGFAVDTGAVWVLPVRVGVPFRALVVTLAGIGLLGVALLVHFGRLLAHEG